MDKLQDYIQIDQKFQNSVNLKLDFGKKERRDSYIPTRSSLLVLRYYLKNVVEKKDKATILIGPYGKGKSHLLLVLLSLLHAKEEMECDILLNKMEQVDEECVHWIHRRFKEQKRYLPVLISATEGSLQQSFLYGMTEALKREGLEELAPASYYSEAVHVLEEWEKTYPETYKNFSELLEKTEKQSCEELKKVLERHTKQAKRAYHIFCNLYPNVTAGATFAPMVRLDTLTIYNSINHILCEEYGYGGIYIVFDEFSKYVENQKKENFSGDMKVLQDICELAQNSREYPLHITLVAHKSIREYGTNLPEEMRNAYLGVEGRIREEYFNVSPQNQYELIANIIQKKGKPWKKDRQVKLWEQIVAESYEKIPAFYGLFSKKEYETVVAKGCYPLLPLTACILLAVSEKVAQNERSVFTFLANDEPDSLRMWMQKNTVSDAWFLGIDVIYDYFYQLFRENASLVRVHTEWLKAEYALQKAETNEEKRMLKAIALLRMIHRPEELPVQDMTLRLSLGVTQEVFAQTKKSLQEKQLIQYRLKRNTYIFQNNVGLDLEKEIRLRMQKETIDNQISELLSEVYEKIYCLPKQYNLDYTMTRFFQYTFLSMEQYQTLPDSEELFRNQPADGKILALYWNLEPSNKEVQEILAKLNDPRLVVLVPDKPFTLKEKLQRFFTIKQLLLDENFLEGNRVLEHELELHQEDLGYMINAELEKQYLPEHQQCKVFDYKGMHDSFATDISFNRYLSELCSSCYKKAPRINHELINRRNISSQMKKARKNLIRQMLQEEDCSDYQKGTSPEATIYRAVMLQTGILAKDSKTVEAGCEEIISQIKHFMQKSVGKKTCFSQLYHTLEGIGYGVRRGVIPLFLAQQFAGLTDLPIVYLREKEVTLTEEILENVNEKPEDYYLYIEASGAKKEKYLSGLQELFVEKRLCEHKETKQKRLQKIVEGMQIFLRSLPQYTLTFREIPTNCEPSGVTLEQIEVFRTELHPMELNPHEILFETFQSRMRVEDYTKLLQCIRKIREYLKGFLNQVEEVTVREIKQMFGVREEESLFRCLKDWYESASEKAKYRVLSDSEIHFLQCLEDIKTNDEHKIVKKLSKAILDLYPEDWKDQSKEFFLSQLKEMKEQFEKEQKGEQVGKKYFSFIGDDGKQVEKYYEVQEDSTSEFLSNAIEEALDEFGDTLEINQKVSVLIQVLERLIKG